ncbi:DUF2127 domain-containing protein [Williamsia sp. CHRR-6]|uniref:DUF2127 domain-containing protein n=1 Tax=Williamsia sp. CHRR-6 TaxID=2835871 RepID=UPI001BD9E2EE|nr:DUF2127 domain-containing protein [Williamsia sp. CHRR-6]MBT0567090.1 DUF2127 domain-containing protein [Williamsia sp. CHRR-6]
MDWSLRACSRRGHATYDPTDHPGLRDRLHVTTAAGEAWRCLRCGVFAVGEPRGRGPADEAPDIAGGNAARDRVVLRLLAVERGLRGVVLLLAAFAVIQFRNKRESARHVVDKELPLLRPLADQLGWNIDDSKIVRLIESSFTLSSTTLVWIGVGIIVYAALQLIEATGLWLMKRWGEYFAVVATSIFLPLEIYELTEKVTVLRILLLAVNIAAVAWLVWSKRLFGANGGSKAYQGEHHANSLLTVERAAA